MSQQQMVNLTGQSGGGMAYGAMAKQLNPGLVGQYTQAQGGAGGVVPSAGLPGSAGASYAAPSLLHQQQQQMQFQHLQHQQHQHQQQLQHFWQQQMQEVEQAHDFKNHQLPLARIKKIMKADEDVRMISAEAPVVFSKACEMFILELTLRSWIHTEENKRRTLQKNDIAGAITRTDIFDFLVDIVPRDELKEEGIGVPRAQVPMGGADVSYSGVYFMPQASATSASSAMQQAAVVPPQMMVGRPASGLQLDPSGMYSHTGGGMQYVQQAMPQAMWPQQGLPGSLPQQQS